MAEGSADVVVMEESKVGNGEIADCKNQRELVDNESMSVQEKSAEGMDIDIPTGKESAMAPEGEKEEIRHENIPQSLPEATMKNRPNLRVDTDVDSAGQPLGEATGETEHALEKQRPTEKRTPTSKEMEAELDNLQKTFDTILSPKTPDAADKKKSSKFDVFNRLAQASTVATIGKRNISSGSSPAGPSTQRRMRGKVAPATGAGVLDRETETNKRKVTGKTPQSTTIATTTRRAKPSRIPAPGTISANSANPSAKANRPKPRGNVFDRLSKSETQASKSKKLNTTFVRRTYIKAPESVSCRNIKKQSSAVSSKTGGGRSDRGAGLSSSQHHSTVCDRLAKTDTAASKMRKKRETYAKTGGPPSQLPKRIITTSRSWKTAQLHNQNLSNRTMSTLSSLSSPESVFDRLSQAQTEASSSRIRPPMPYEPTKTPPRHHAGQSLSYGIRLLCSELKRNNLDNDNEMMVSSYFTELSPIKLHLVGSMSAYEAGVIDSRRLCSAIIDSLFARDFTPAEEWRVGIASVNPVVAAVNDDDDDDVDRTLEETFIVEKKAIWRDNDVPNRTAAASGTIYISMDKKEIRVDQYFFRVTG